MKEEVMTLDEAARYLRLGPRTLYDLIHKRRVPALMVGGKWLFPKTSLDRWLQHQAESHVATSQNLSTFDRILKRAEHEAQLQGFPHVGGDHLLIAIAEETGSVAAAVLQEHGLQAAQIQGLQRKSAGTRTSTGPAKKTPRLKTILDRAEELRQEGTGEISAEQLLEILISEPGVVAMTLKAAKVTPSTLRTALREKMQKAGGKNS